MGKQMALLNTT